ncbi:hypothetical protein [Candidatus Pyrohabitans sp.]
MRRSFDRDYILREFERIDAGLNSELWIYMIGGGAMALTGIKEATKDVDIIVPGRRDAERLRSILSDLGYRKVPKPGEEYIKMGASFILENVDGFRWDIFVAQVMGKFIFSEGMRSRATPFGNYKRLKVGIASSSDIFLFKSITEREGDLEDMLALVRAGIDSEALLQEVETQRKLLGTEVWLTYLNAKLDELEEKYGVTLPVKERIEEMASKVYNRFVVISLLKERDLSMEELEGRAEMSREDMEEVISDLLKRKIIKRVKGKLKLISERL